MSTQRQLGAEKGPVYGVDLLIELPISATMFQAFPGADELSQCNKRFPRVVAAFEVLTAEFHKAHRPEKTQ